MRYVDNVRRRCRVHPEGQTKIANNGGPEVDRTDVVAWSKDKDSNIETKIICEVGPWNKERMTV